MNIAIPFFGKTASAAAHHGAIAPALQRLRAKADALRFDVRRLRPFVRPEPTLFQRCLATHMYFAARKSALD
jgi:hypothetical protein